MHPGRKEAFQSGQTPLNFKHTQKNVSKNFLLQKIDSCILKQSSRRKRGSRRKIFLNEIKILRIPRFLREINKMRLPWHFKCCICSHSLPALCRNKLKGVCKMLTKIYIVSHWDSVLNDKTVSTQHYMHLQSLLYKPMIKQEDGVMKAGIKIMFFTRYMQIMPPS